MQNNDTTYVCVCVCVYVCAECVHVFREKYIVSEHAYTINTNFGGEQRSRVNNVQEMLEPPGERGLHGRGMDIRTHGERP